jgi:hypothetical protein
MIMRAEFQEKALLPTPLSKQTTKSVPLVGAFRTLHVAPKRYRVSPVAAPRCRRRLTAQSAPARRAPRFLYWPHSGGILARQCRKSMAGVGVELTYATQRPSYILACGGRDKDKPRFLCGEILKVEFVHVKNQADILTTHTLDILHWASTNLQSLSYTPLHSLAVLRSTPATSAHYAACQSSIIFQKTPVSGPG